MALSTYTELQADIASWLNKSNLTAYIPSFIKLAEADFNRRLRISLLESTATGTLSSDTIDLSALTRFRKIRTAWITSGNDRVVLNYVSPAQYTARNGENLSGTGIPVEYTIQGQNMILNPSPDSNYDWTIWYYQTVEDLAAATTNTILTNYPDLYLYGSLVAAEPFLKNDQRMATWKLMYEQALKMTTQESIHDRQGGTSRQVSEMGTP